MSRWHTKLVLVCLALAPAGAWAGEIETGRMTWPEIRDALASGKTTVIIPSGGTEQNGPHMVTGKHNVIVAETARRIAATLGDALVAPVIAYTPEGDVASREGHMAYPGTVSIPPPVFQGLLEAAGASFAANGFKTIVFLGDSGPNQAPQQRAAAALNRLWAGTDRRALSADHYYAENGQQAWLLAAGETEGSIGHHAGIGDTSELMAVAPDGVRLDKRAADRDGASGDATRATAERGEKLLALKVAAAVAEIRLAREAAPAPAAGGAGEGLFARAWRWLFE